MILKMAQLCFICSKPLTESKIVVVDREIKTLIIASAESNYSNIL